MQRLKKILTSWLVVGLSTSAVLANPVSSQLSRNQTTVGMPVQLQVVVDGTTNASLPRTVEIDGLQMALTGRSTQVRVENMRMSTSAVYVYTIIADREGTYTIPSIDVMIGGKTYRTNPAELTVSGGGGQIPAPRAAPVVPQGPQAPQPPGLSDEPGSGDVERRIAFAELVIPQTSAFVGEVIPVELRCYFRGGYSFQLEQRPEFTAEGLTVQRWAEPQRGEQLIDGAPYHVFTFRSAITPVKSGELEIPPATLNAIGRVPSQSQFGVDDLIEEFFGGSGMMGFGGQRREIQLASEPLSLEVKPLPREGRPEGFEGAVGEFTIAANTTQPKVGPGEPLTLEVVLAGRGNFDSIPGVNLVDDDGWKSYPPTAEFEPTDAIGFGGTKIFEYHLVAESDQTQTPVAEFSYFDPAREKYFTISTEPTPVIATAPPRPAATPPTVTGPDDATPSPALAEATDGSGNGAPAREALFEKAVVRSFQAIVESTGFIVVNSALAVAMLAFIIGALFKRAAGSEAGVRAGKLRESKRLLAAAETPGLSDEEFFRRIEAFLEFEAARNGADDAMAWSSQLTEPRKAGLQQILARAHEARFGGGLAVALDSAGRRQIITDLKGLAS